MKLEMDWSGLEERLVECQSECDRLRQIITRCAAVVGAVVTEQATVEFLSQVPDEILAYIAYRGGLFAGRDRKRGGDEGA